jgi:uncharacterized membrane protein
MKKNAMTSFADHVVNQLLLLGIGFILWAVLFIIWPASFVYLVSAFFIIFGGQSIIYALRIRRARKDMENWISRVGK